MGEYAEMMLDGTCCACCGELLGGPMDWDDPQGFPGLCPSCAESEREFEVANERPIEPSTSYLTRRKSFGCSLCDRWFGSKNAAKQHLRDKHDITA